MCCTYYIQGGQNLLWIASSKGHRDIVDLLIKKGAKIDEADEVGNTETFINGTVVIACVDSSEYLIYHG